MTIHEFIDQGHFEKDNTFEEYFLETWKTFSNIPRNIPKYTKYVIKEIPLEGVLYSQVVKIRNFRKTYEETRA